MSEQKTLWAVKRGIREDRLCGEVSVAKEYDKFYELDTSSNWKVYACRVRKADMETYDFSFYLTEKEAIQGVIDMSKQRIELNKRIIEDKIKTNELLEQTIAEMEQRLKGE